MSEHYITLLSIGLQTLVILLGGYAAVIRNDTNNTALKEEIKAMQTELKTLSHVVTQLAVQENRLDNQAQRLNMIDRIIDDLRRGRGYIERDTRAGLSGEYGAK